MTSGFDEFSLALFTTLAPDGSRGLSPRGASS